MKPNRTRFEEKVARRRRTAAWFSVGHLSLLSLGAAVIDILVFWLALDLSLSVRLIVTGTLAFFIVLAYMSGWSSQRNFKGTVDTWLADSDEVEKLVLAAAIQDDHAKFLELAQVVDVTPPISSAPRKEGEG